MKRNIVKFGAILGIATLGLSSCSNTEPPLVWFPDMYFPVAYDPLQKAEAPYTDHENEVPAFVKQNGATGLYPVEGTVPQNPEGVFPEGLLPKNVDEYNAGYDASKLVTSSPLNPANADKDIERGKKLYEKTCLACHGAGGDGQGPIVASGAYLGVPKYADRDITLGSVHYVIVNGRNAMGSFAGQLTPADRWRVAMYVMSAFKGGVAPAPAATEASTTTETNTTTP